MSSAEERKPERSETRTYSGQLGERGAPELVQRLAEVHARVGREEAARLRHGSMGDTTEGERLGAIPGMKRAQPQPTQTYTCTPSTHELAGSMQRPPPSPAAGRVRQRVERLVLDAQRG